MDNFELHGTDDSMNFYLYYSLFFWRCFIGINSDVISIFVFFRNTLKNIFRTAYFIAT